MDFGPELLLHSDADGNNLLYYAVKGFFVSRPESNEYWKFVTDNSHFKLFLGMLQEMKNFDGHRSQLDRVVRELLLHEDEYRELITHFDRQFPQYITRYKEGRRFSAPLLTQQMRQELQSAHNTAQLMLSITEGDMELGEAFSMLERYPSLVNAYAPEGQSILRYVSSEYVACASVGYRVIKEARLQGLFAYLLVKGANFAERSPRIIIHVDRAQKKAPLSYAYYAANRLLPPVVTFSAQEEAPWNSVEEYTRHMAPKLHNYTQLAKADPRKLLTIFPWLEEYMPKEVQEPDQQQDDADNAQADQEGQVEPKKSLWEHWQPTLKTIAVGAAAGAALYRFWFAPGSHPESLKATRQPKV